MKNSIALSILAVTFMMTGCAESVPPVVKPIDMAAGKDNIAVYIVWDGSGSMGDNVANAKGEGESKDAISRRALKAIADRFDQYLTMSTNRAVFLGFVVLNGGKVLNEGFGIADNTKKASEVVAKWNVPSPNGGTPLGFAIKLASEQLNLIQNARSKHVMVLTDGGSNSGPAPETVMDELFKANIKSSIHFVAFDVNSGLFDAAKNKGATVVGASNEKELNEKFDFILKEKILLERED